MLSSKYQQERKEEREKAKLLEKSKLEAISESYKEVINTPAMADLQGFIERGLEAESNLAKTTLDNDHVSAHHLQRSVVYETIKAYIEAKLR